MGFLINPYRFAVVGAPDFEDDFATDNYTDVGTGVGVSGGLMQFIDSAGGDNRAWQSLGLTLSDTTWVTDYGYKRGSGTTGNIPSYALCFSNGSSDPISGDMLGQRVDTGGATYPVRYDNGVSGVGSGFSFSNDVQYYIRLVRSTATNLTLNMFTDSERTTHISGSPISLTIPSTVISLTHVQHAMKSNQSGGSYDAQIDNLEVWDGITTPP